MAWKIEPRSIKKPIENTMKKEGILEASWRRLGASWALKNPLEPLVPLNPRRGGGYAEAPLKDSLGFLLDILICISLVFP